MERYSVMVLKSWRSIFTNHQVRFGICECYRSLTRILQVSDIPFTFSFLTCLDEDFSEPIFLKWWKKLDDLKSDSTSNKNILLQLFIRFSETWISRKVVHPSPLQQNIVHLEFSFFPQPTLTQFDIHLIHAIYQFLLNSLDFF